MRRRLLPLVLVSLMLTSSMASVLGASGREAVDNWDDGDAWVEISLISWVANQTEEWDSSGGLPDPQFRICFDVDGEDLDCVNTPTWENQWELNATWNYTIDIPDTSNLLNITIECEDNDAFNDDECDMNADVNEWKLYAEYNWSQNPNMTISGNGDGDGNGTWKNAASVWEVKVFGFGDEDDDGVLDNLDLCAGTSQGDSLINNSTFLGCSWGQVDFDGDGIISDLDDDPFNANIGTVLGGSREFVLKDRTDYECRNFALSNIERWPSDDNVPNPIPLAIFVNKNTTQNYCDYIEQYQNGEISIDQITSPTKYLELNGNNFTRIQGDSLGWSTGQIGPNGSPLIHKLAELGPNNECRTAIVSLREPSINILELNYSTYENDNEQIRCYDNQYGNGDENIRYRFWESHLGTFGDFDGNNVIDFVQVNDRCVIYLGISDNPVNFYQPIILEKLDNLCEDGPIASADLDNDGFDDIITDHSIIFMNDDMNPEIFNLTWDSTFGDHDEHFVNVIDYDEDGDLDILNRQCKMGFRDICYQTIYLNAWFADDDLDGVSNSDDRCPESELSHQVDDFGCSDIQRYRQRWSNRCFRCLLETHLATS